MDKIFTRGGIVVTEPPVQSLREKLMLAASAGILACVAPSGFYGIRAQAQAVPVECDDTSITGSASLIVPGAVFSPNSAKLDNQRVSFGADAKVYFSDKVYGHIRYDTTQSDQFSEHKGWAGVTFRF